MFFKQISENPLNQQIIYDIFLLCVYIRNISNLCTVEKKLLITLFPLIFVSFFSLIQSILLSSFAADCAIRIYEETLNNLTNSNLFFLYKDLHDVFHSHRNKIGWSPQSFMMYLIAFGVSILPYIYSVLEGEEWLRQNHGKAVSFIYLAITISLPFLVLNLYMKSKRSIDKKVLGIRQSDMIKLILENDK